VLTLMPPNADLFASAAQTLINPVNCEGVMGAGLARVFRRLYPAMFEEYQTLCRQSKLAPGAFHLWCSPTRWVLNFPTKTAYRAASKLEYIEVGLVQLRRTYREQGITSLAMPALGCGLGGLRWSDVRRLCERELSVLDITIELYPPR